MTVTGATRIAGVMGWPVSHSRSPRLQNFWLGSCGIDGVYVPFPVPPERLEQALHALPALGICGVNVTVPHKEAAFALMDSRDEAATRIGAVNTVVVGGDDALHGMNTDGFGFIESLREGAPSWRADAGPAVVIGAGGAARAIVCALQDAGAPVIRIVNRTGARARTLAEAFGGGCEAVPWTRRGAALGDAALLVNATTQGMTGAAALDIPLAALPETAVVTDIVYTPLETPLLAAARTRGNAVVDGLGMLLHQARPGFRAWFGRDPEVTEDLRRHVLADLGA